jgi:lysyl-tRNA synthetase class 2
MTIPDPAYFQYEAFQTRTAKLHEIKHLGIDPYPHKYRDTVSVCKVLSDCEGKEMGHSEEAGSGQTDSVCVTGRLVMFRGMGKNAFGHIQDGSDQIQIMCNRDITVVEGYEPTAELNHLKFIEKKLDFGDIIGIEGNLFKTQKGEITIFVKKLTLLCKSLLPLPDKHSGLVDKEVRYRKRWLDLISNPESMKRFKDRSKIVRTIRNYMADSGFDEVETPILQNVYGGAAAEPFTTHLNSLKQDMFLRISLEIPLKELIIGGMQKIYEIGKVFRNESIDRTHNPEFTMIEAYAAGWDYNDMMTFTENLFRTVALNVFGDTKLRWTPEGESTAIVIDFDQPWKRISMKGAVKEYGGHDVDTMSDVQMRELLLKETKLDPKEVHAATRGLLIALIFEEFAEKHLIQPHHIIDHPIDTTPLCKLHRDPELRNEGFVERFESFILCREMCNSYTELNDPELQRKLLVDQANKKEAGDLEASPLDEEFLEAICQGMPPTGGVGIGIDRLVMLFTSAESIRDVLLFPIMKPE